MSSLLDRDKLGAWLTGHPNRVVYVSEIRDALDQFAVEDVLSTPVTISVEHGWVKAEDCDWPDETIVWSASSFTFQYADLHYACAPHGPPVPVTMRAVRSAKGPQLVVVCKCSDQKPPPLPHPPQKEE